jgi:hypothetical protein
MIIVKHQMINLSVVSWKAASDKVYHLLAHGRWFSPDTPASSTTKTGRHDIAESGVKTPKIKIKSIIAWHKHLLELLD